MFCIPHQQFRRDGGYVTQTLAAGKWSLRIRSTSLAGNGSWTPRIYFDVTKPVGSFQCRAAFYPVAVLGWGRGRAQAPRVLASPSSTFVATYDLLHPES